MGLKEVVGVAEIKEGIGVEGKQKNGTNAEFEVDVEENKDAAEDYLLVKRRS